MFYVRYDSTGEIKTVGINYGPDASSIEEEVGLTTIVTNEIQHDEMIHYVDNGVIVDRPLMPITLNGAVLSGIPVGTLAYSDAEPVYINDGDMDLSGSTPGTHTIRFLNFPYVMYVAEVTIT